MLIMKIYYKINGGEGGIRTPEGFNPLPVFKTGAFNRSATSPVIFFNELGYPLPALAPFIAYSLLVGHQTGHQIVPSENGTVKGRPRSVSLGIVYSLSSYSY